MPLANGYLFTATTPTHAYKFIGRVKFVDEFSHQIQPSRLMMDHDHQIQGIKTITAIGSASAASKV